MAEPKSKRRYLDETRYLDEQGRIHLVSLTPRSIQGSITQGRTPIRKFTDEVAGTIKAQLSGDEPISPYLAYPMAGAITLGLSNPITTLGGIVKSAGGAMLVNNIVDKLTGKESWGQYIGDMLNVNPDFAEMFTPGLGLNKFRIRNTIRNTGVSTKLNKIAKNYIDTGKLPHKLSDRAKDVIDAINDQKTKTLTTSGSPIKYVDSDGNFSINLDNNIISGIPAKNGNVIIDDASFFNPTGSANRLLQHTWKDLIPGDKITIGNIGGSLSADSYPLYLANLRKVLRNTTDKGFKIIPKGYTHLNKYGQDRYKGFVIPPDGSNKFYSDTRIKLAKQIKALGEEYAEKYGTNPFKYKPVINPEYNLFHFGNWGVPAFEIVKLKYGGSSNRRSLATGGSIYIKPSHRGRLTELKARTGKSEAELYNDGNPSHKKMVVFARNARKWKH